MATLLRMVNKQQRARLALLVTPPPKPEAPRQLVLRLAR